MSGSVKIDASGLRNVIRTAVSASKEQSRAMLSAANTLRQQIKTGMQQGQPGGEAWPAPSRWTGLAALRSRYSMRTLKWGRTSYGERVRKKSRRNFLSLPPKGKPALRRLSGAVRYAKQVRPGAAGGVEETAVRIGFLNQSAARRAEYHATAGHTQTVTPKMRRFLFAVGLFIRARKIKIPQRRHVEPVYEREKNQIAAGIQARVNAALAKQGL